jgi:hypothetical protein
MHTRLIKPDTQQLPKELEARFYSAIGKFIDSYGWFDYNLGLQISFWHSGSQLDVRKYLTTDSHLKTRLDVLKQMINRSTNRVSEVEQSEYEQWVANVDAIRALRNEYAHGRWIHSKPTADDDGQMTFLPLQWSAGGNAERPPLPTLLSELEAQATQISKLTAQMSTVIVPFLELRARG